MLKRRLLVFAVVLALLLVVPRSAVRAQPSVGTREFQGTLMAAPYSILLPPSILKTEWNSEEVDK